MNQQYHRQGFTIIELLTVLCSGFVVMSTASMLLAIVFDLSGSQRIRRNNIQAQNRLLESFRKDVRQFGDPEILEQKIRSQNAVLLRWKTEKGSVIYRMDSLDRRRVEIQRQVLNSDKIVSRESFVLSPRVRLDFYRGSGKDREDLIALSLWVLPSGSNEMEKKDLDPFTGVVSPSILKQYDPRYISNWRTAIVKVSKRS